MTSLIHEYRREDAVLRHRIAILVWILATAAGAATEEPRVAENVYRGEMASYPGPWAFSIPKPGIILVSDAELETLAADPEKAIDRSLHTRRIRTADLDRAGRVGTTKDLWRLVVT
ncbi:MAG: hypothetical protein MUE50_11110 [Pirellulaceae bacterium]|jgi:hypothetical protein|nr:hypothetical protein [Pirellulaceae bacterium]